HGRLPVRPRRIAGPVPAPARCARGRGGRAGRGGQRLHGSGGALVTAQTEARPNPLIEAGKRAERINSAMADLFEVAEQDVRMGKASPELWSAVCAVREVRR